MPKYVTNWDEGWEGREIKGKCWPFIHKFTICFPDLKERIATASNSSKEHGGKKEEGDDNNTSTTTPTMTMANGLKCNGNET
jgi:hypothetical protein